jgi:hypothetical protein
MREVEITLARLAWIEKIAYTGLTAGIVGLVSALLGLLLG